MGKLKDLIGSELIGQNGEKISTDCISGQGKVLGLYFSAHWCPPCRMFTPELGNWYNTVKETANGDKFDIVFVSSDRDQGQFDEYFKDMPWKAVPYEMRDIKGELSKKFKVSGIPTLVFVDGETGKLITAEGRSVVGDDPTGEKFPWAPKLFKELFSGSVLKKDGETTIEEATKGQIVGLYFSAHWCPPCRGFTPELITTYETLKNAGKNFEVIFLSSDRSQESFDEYYGTMPWLALPYNDPRKKALSQHFGVGGIPTLVILDEDLQVITDNGRAAVGADKQGQKFPWIPEPLVQLSEESVSTVNETPCIIFFTDGDEEKVAKALECLQDIANRETQTNRQKRKAGEDVDDEVLYFFEGKEDEDEGGTAESLRSFLNLEDWTPMVLFLDIPGAKKFIVPKTEQLTKQRIEELVADYRASKLDMVPLR